MPQESTNSIREALGRAWDDVESGTAASGSGLEPIVDDPVKPVGSASEGSGLEEQVVVDPNKEETGGNEELDAARERVRQSAQQEQQRQKTQEQGKQKQQGQQKQGQQQQTQQQQAATSKAPQSWRPTTRVHWDKLPKEVQEEVTKREREVSTALVQSAAARKFNEEFGNVVRPFEGLMRASGMDNPLKVVNNLMTTAATLQTGTPQQKAGTVANIIRAYGVDLATLDQLLAAQMKGGGGARPANGGNGGGADPSEAIMRAIDARLAPVTKFISQHEATTSQNAQRMQQEATQTLEEFKNDPKNEFYNDLAEDMADLLDLNAQRGREMTLRQAYDLAAANHPEVSKVITQRKAAERAASGASSVERARRASASQSGGSPASVGKSSAKPKGVRAAVSAAWDDLSAN